MRASQYLPSDKGLEQLFDCLKEMKSNPDIMLEMDSIQLSDYLQNWQHELKQTAAGKEEALAKLAEFAHLSILALLRDTAIQAAIFFVKKAGLIGDSAENTLAEVKAAMAEENSDREVSEEVDQLKQDAVRNTVRSFMTPGYNLAQFVADYTEQGDDLKISEEHWRQLSAEFTGPYQYAGALNAWYGSKTYSIIYHGPDVPVEVEVFQKDTVQ